MEGSSSRQPPAQGSQPAFSSSELFKELLAAISGDKEKNGQMQQKLEEIMKSYNISHDTMLKKLNEIREYQARKAAEGVSRPDPLNPALKTDTGIDNSPFLSSSAADASAYPISQTLNVTNPGPATWANQRPSLTGGSAAGRISGTPSQIAREDPIPITFTADHRTQPRKNPTGDLSMRRTIHDLVASVDPNVKIEPEVEDLLLSIADEFIDSVTNFACRLAKHRGGDTLEVRDLQLHLERNHNIRIPGFSSDDTRISLSQSSILPAAGTTAAAKKPTQGTHMTLRSQRLAQVQQAKRESKLM